MDRDIHYTDNIDSISWNGTHSKFSLVCIQSDDKIIQPWSARPSTF